MGSAETTAAWSRIMHAMRRVSRLSQFVEEATETCLVQRSSMSFVTAARTSPLVGIAVWGEPTWDDAEALVHAHEALRPVLSPHVAYVDLRHVDAIRPDSFDVIGGLLQTRGAWLAETIRRLAVVRGTGIVGATTAGFFDVLPRPFPLKVFADPSEALGWLDHDAPDRLLGEVDGLLEEARGMPSLLRALRTVLDAQPGAQAMPEVAQAVGLSPRSLQRKLKALRTTFLAEQNQSQVRVAKRLLADPDTAIAVVATKVGCASVANFSALFRRLTGVTPSQFRADVRGKPS